MKIVATEYHTKFAALEVFISGCKAPHCKGCHNSEIWDFTKGTNWREYKDVLSRHAKSGMVDEIWVMGGEPLDQDPDELEAFLTYLTLTKKDIMLWTRYSEVPERFKKYLNKVKTGPYLEDRPSYVDELTGIELASDNQMIITL